jgi:hypothetical protein
VRPQFFLSEKWHLEGGSWEKTYGKKHLRRHLGRGIWEETSEEKPLGILW